MNKILELLSTKGLVQSKYSFDKKTVKKIARGSLIAASGAVGLYLLNCIGKIETSNEALASFVVFIVPTLTNAIMEWVKGEING